MAAVTSLGKTMWSLTKIGLIENNENTIEVNNRM